MMSPAFVVGRDLGDENEIDVRIIENALEFDRQFDRVFEELARIKPIDPSSIAWVSRLDARAFFK